jgi:hypothetical protein
VIKTKEPLTVRDEAIEPRKEWKLYEGLRPGANTLGIEGACGVIKDLRCEEARLKINDLGYLKLRWWNGRLHVAENSIPDLGT